MVEQNPRMLVFPETPEIANRSFQRFCTASGVEPIKPRHRRYSTNTIWFMLDGEEKIDGVDIREAVKLPGSLAWIASAWGGLGNETRAAVLRECQECNIQAAQSVLREGDDV